MKFLKTIGKILSTFIGILISITCILMITYMAISNYMKVDNLKKSINTKNLLKIEVDENTLRENIVETFEEIEISEKDINSVIESEEFNELFDDYINKVMEYYLENKDFPTFDDSKIEKLVDLVASKNNTITEEEKKYIIESIKKEKIEIENTLPNREEVQNDETINKVINFYNSISIFYFVGTIIILMFLIFIFTWSLYYPFLYTGISFVATSLSLIGSYLFKNTIINALNMEEFINIILNQVFYQFLIYSLIMLLIGIIFITFYIITNKIKNKVEA